jgi:hypothetical protein
MSNASAKSNQTRFAEAIPDSATGKKDQLIPSSFVLLGPLALDRFGTSTER